MASADDPVPDPRCIALPSGAGDPNRRTVLGGLVAVSTAPFLPISDFSEDLLLVDGWILRRSDLVRHGP